MTEIHNFKVGDVVNVFRIYPFNADGTANRDNKRVVEGKAIIVALQREEDMYKVQFAFREGKFEGRKYVRYVNPNQEVDS